MELEEEVAPVFAKRRFRPINRKTKTQVVFDEKARREFLTGFHKRKLDRKKRAQEELKMQLKEEKKRIRQESKDQHKKLTKTYQPIPELEERMAQLHQVKNSTVSILELDADLLAENNFIIGSNRVNYEGEAGDEENTDREVKSECDEEINFSIKREPEEEKEIKTKKEFMKELKKRATKIVKKSAAFKKLNKQQQIKQRKQSKRKKDIKLRQLDKSNKKKNRKK